MFQFKYDTIITAINSCASCWFTFIRPMRTVHSLIAIVLLGSSLLIYLTLNLQIYHPRTIPEYLLRVSANQSYVAEITTRASIQNHGGSAAHPNVSISDSLKNDIPQNGAYWNRLLHRAIRELAKGEKMLAYEWSHCRENNHKVLQTNVHDFISYPQRYQDFLKGLNCRHPPMLIDQPNKYISRTGDKQIFLLLAIKSRPGNFKQRQAVRETWGKEGVYMSDCRVRTVFLLGSLSGDNPDLGPLLSFEAKQFGDILQWDFDESLINLALKVHAFFNWSWKNRSQISFVFYGDDDVFVNTPEILRFLHSLEPSQVSQFYVGHVIGSAGPVRDASNKYYVPLSFYDGTYPAYAGGGGLLFSGLLLEPLYYISSVVPLFPIDDVYIGMCFKALGMSPAPHKGFHTFDIREQDRENVCVHKDLMLIHQRTPREIKRLWKGIHNPLLTC